MKIRAVFLLAIGLLFGRESFAVTQLITNGGFEAASPAPWQVAAGGFQVNVPVVTSTNAFDGNNYLNLGNFTGINSEGIYQTVTIPTNALLAQFTYVWKCSIGNDPAGVDLFESIVEANNNPIAMDQESSQNTGYYNQSSFNLTAYAGQAVNVGFVIQAQQPGVGAQTFFAVDDVSLLVYTPDDIPPNDYFTNATPIVTSTTATAFGTNVLATSEPGEGKHAGANPTHSLWWTWTAPSNGVVTMNTVGSTFNTVLGVYTGPTVSNLTQVAANDDQNSGQGIVTSQVKFPVSAGTTYDIVVDGKGGATGSAQLNMSFVPDTKAPTVSISSPKSGAKLTNSTVTVTGTASDNVAVGFVQYRLENAAGTNDYQLANGSNSWSATVTGLIPGANTIRVQAFDTSSNASPTTAVSVTYAVVSPISLSINPVGSGTVLPNMNNELLAVGNSFTMTAKPAAGQIFAGWTGSLTASTPALKFVMQSNMVLVANFVPNPFIPVAGGYQGLFFDTNNPVHQSSGSITLTLTTAGSFTAKIILAGTSYSLPGSFAADGSFSNNIARKGLTPVSVQMNLDMAGGGITGQLSDGTFLADLTAGRVATSAGANAGNFTLLIPGGADGVAQPGGDSYGTVKIASTGAITFAGELADGTKITQKANLLTSGDWAFYVPLYSGKGSIFGLLSFNNGTISGGVDWFKTAAAGGKIYPAGFTLTPDAVGSVYHFTNGVSALNPAPVELWLANGNLAFTNQVAMDSTSKITSTNTTLKVTVTTSTGLIKGTVANPATGKTVSFNGVVLQNQNYGGGFFVGTNQTGRVFLGP